MKRAIYCYRATRDDLDSTTLTRVYFNPIFPIGMIGAYVSWVSSANRSAISFGAFCPFRSLGKFLSVIVLLALYRLIVIKGTTEKESPNNVSWVLGYHPLIEVQ